MQKISERTSQSDDWRSTIKCMFSVLAAMSHYILINLTRLFCCIETSWKTGWVETFDILMTKLLYDEKRYRLHLANGVPLLEPNHLSQVWWKQLQLKWTWLIWTGSCELAQINLAHMSLAQVRWHRERIVLFLNCNLKVAREIILMKAINIGSKNPLCKR